MPHHGDIVEAAAIHERDCLSNRLLRAYGRQIGDRYHHLCKSKLGPLSAFAGEILPSDPSEKNAIGFYGQNARPAANG